MTISKEVAIFTGLVFLLGLLVGYGIIGTDDHDKKDFQPQTSTSTMNTDEMKEEIQRLRRELSAYKRRLKDIHALTKSYQSGQDKGSVNRNKDLGKDTGSEESVR